MTDKTGFGDVTINMRWVRVPLHTRVANTEAVGVVERRGQVHVLDLLARLNVIHLVEPLRRLENIGVRSRANLRLRPAKKELL